MNKKAILKNIKYLLWFLPDKFYLKLYYRLIFKRKLDLNNPITYNEKLQWLKLYDRKEEYVKLVDKYEVREYIKEKIGEEYLVPIYGVWDKFDDIDFDKLPNKFVLKCTHDSGGVVICKDKNNFDFKGAKEKIVSCLKKNYFYIGREWPYKKVKPRIIAEKYLESVDGDIRDYKFMCFNQKVKCSFVCSGRNDEKGLAVDFFDLNWNKMDLKRKYRNSDTSIEKPKNYDKMIELAEILSINIPFVRVDFYEINNRIFFGELTLYPGCGFEKFTPETWDYKFGEWLKIK